MTLTKTFKIALKKAFQLKATSLLTDYNRSESNLDKRGRVSYNNTDGVVYTLSYERLLESYKTLIRELSGSIPNVDPEVFATYL